MSDPKITTLLNQVAKNPENGADDLMVAVQGKLKALAAVMLRDESPAHTLQATALVHEAYLRMVDQTRVDWRGKTHFFAISARMMRRILVDHARKHLRDKRGGGRKRIEFSDDLFLSNKHEQDVLVVEDVLNKLAEIDERQAQIVELRFFGGLTVSEVAEVLKVSKRTVESEWTIVRAWLRRELTNDSPDDENEA